MKYYLLCSAALMMAGPALAQGAGQMGQETAPTGQAMPEQVTPEQAAPQQAQPQQSQSANVAAVVESEFPVYDSDKSGDLNSTEFSAWMTALKKAEMASTGQVLGEGEIAAWAGAAFTMADQDKSKAVSKTELVSYLGG